MTFELKEAQRRSLAKSWKKPGFGHFLEQGLGKTSLTLFEFLELQAEGLVDRLVVIAPSTFKRGWVVDAQKFGFNLEGHVYTASGGASNEWFLRRKYEAPPMIVVNYESVRGKKCQEYIKRFVQGKRWMIVADESVQISTHNSLQTEQCIELAKSATFRRILSGKPLKQGPHDYWSQMRFIGALDGFSYFPFLHTFCLMGGFKGKSVVGAKNVERLAETLDPHCFFATKAEYTDLPPKAYSTREYDLSPEMQAHYDSMMEEFVVWLNSDEVVAIEVAITKYIKLAQIQAGYIIDEQRVVQELVSPEKNTRFRALRSFIDNELVGKATIPYNSKYSGAMLYRQLQDLNPAYIRGGMKDAEIEAQKAKFNNDRTCRVILLQTRSAKYGHTLLGQPGPDRCSTCLMYENTYSLDDRSQIEDRNHRYGQDADRCDYIDFIGTELDRDCVDALLRKESMFVALRNLISAKPAA